LPRSTSTPARAYAFFFFVISVGEADSFPREGNAFPTKSDDRLLLLQIGEQRPLLAS